MEPIERRHCYPRRVEVERLGGDLGDQSWLQRDMERVVPPGPPPPDRNACGDDQDRPGRRGDVPLDALVPDFAFLWRSVDQDERVMGRGRHFDLGSGRVAVACRQHADTATPVARRERREGNEPGPLARPERAAAARLLQLHDLSPVMNRADGTDPSA